MGSAGHIAVLGFGAIALGGIYLLSTQAGARPLTQKKAVEAPKPTEIPPAPLTKRPSSRPVPLAQNRLVPTRKSSELHPSTFRRLPTDVQSLFSGRTIEDPTPTRISPTLASREDLEERKLRRAEAERLPTITPPSEPEPTAITPRIPSRITKRPTTFQMF